MLRQETSAGSPTNKLCRFSTTKFLRPEKVNVTKTRRYFVIYVCCVATSLFMFNKQWKGSWLTAMVFGMCKLCGRTAPPPHTHTVIRSIFSGRVRFINRRLLEEIFVHLTEVSVLSFSYFHSGSCRIRCPDNEAACLGFDPSFRCSCAR